MAAIVHLSPPALHPPVVSAPEHKAIVAETLSTIAAEQNKAVERLALTELLLARAPLPESFDIPLTTVSLGSNFQAHINIRFADTQGPSTPLLVDSGNSSLIVPYYEHIAALSNFHARYEVLAENAVEPWGCPAKVLRGPIVIPTRTGNVFTIPACVFFACTADNPNEDPRTANFGAGWASLWREVGAITMQSPLTYNSDYPYAEFNYAPSDKMFAAEAKPFVVAGQSHLTMYRTMPSDYLTFDILRDCYWMSLSPRALSIGNTVTAWPGDIPSPIAMVDTGGGPVILSDPKGYVHNRHWPQPVDNPWWTPPDVCQSIKEDLSITVGDAHGSFSYRVHMSDMPASVQGLTLVMCHESQFMRGNNGINIGGLSALFNYILIDYSLGKVGFKPKPAALV